MHLHVKIEANIVTRRSSVRCEQGVDGYKNHRQFLPHSLRHGMTVLD